VWRGARAISSADTFNGSAAGGCNSRRANFLIREYLPFRPSSPAPCSQTLTLTYDVRAAAGSLSPSAHPGQRRISIQLAAAALYQASSRGSVVLCEVTFAPLAPGPGWAPSALTDSLGNRAGHHSH